MSHRFSMAIIDYGRTVPPYMTLAFELGAAAKPAATKDAINRSRPPLRRPLPA